MRRSLIKSLWLTGLVLVGLQAWAQRTVTGKVSDANAAPISGATVSVVNGTANAVTSEAGTFTITIPNGEVRLRFSHVNFQPMEMAVGNNSQLDVIMTAVNASLEEVVIIGYGAQKKVTMTGAVGTIDSKKLQDRPVASLTEALQGQVPGLTVVRTSAQPGNQSIDFRIRGTSTFSSNPVLTIVDGVPSSLDRINPADIESISVLKDAASAAIYGSRATGGVILVTTKTGRKGPPRVSLNSSIGLQRPTRFPKKVSALDHALLSNEARANDGQPAKYSQADIDRLSSPDFKEVNWDDYLLGDAMQTDHNISISGGNEFNDYYISFGYLRQNGIVLNTGYERMNIQANQNFRLNNKLKIGVRLGYTPSVQTSPTGNQLSSVLTGVAALPNTD
ncbi:MAG: SusC/RagA family TonB-linked outer membrane protein, partial [Chitinophagaceae bacterium]|nr:SusC/RagA family TonB-linked outer membrane protein [Chitinophagaceae bacterium]